MLGGNVGIRPDLPGAYIEAAFWVVGPSCFDNGIEVPILWRELEAYANISPIDWLPWELMTIMRMSKAYVAEKRVKDPFRIPPIDRGEVD
jgi:hypothetical protein